ncbi:MAG TPA: CHAT domain-containing protein [Thermoanaerobaculia bacterium]|nr:CHAT domain-containing protein [Thermoanaerobaculia bacterium]
MRSDLRSEPSEREDARPHLEVFVERGDDLEFEVHVETSLGDGPARRRFREPFAEREVAALHQWAASGRGSKRVWDSETEPREQLRQLGQRLFEAVFAGEVLSRLRSALAAAREHGRPLALRLRLRGDARLAEWPWESLWDPHSRSYLALDQVTVSRVVEEVSGTPRSNGGRELRVLVVAASPRGQADLGVDGELAQIQAAFAGGSGRRNVTLVSHPHATRRTLRELLKRAHFDVLHFIGHGEPAAILLEGEGGRPDPVSAQELSGMFRRRPVRGRRRSPTLPRLVVLNACDSARLPGSGRLDGLAQQLVRSGVPAVIAMAFPISDGTALRFSEELYDRLALGVGPEEALTEVRNELSTRGHGTGWLAPVLYLHPQRSQLGPEAWPLRPAPWPRWLGGLGLASLAGWLLWLWYSNLPVVLPPSDPACPSPDLVELHFVKIDPAGGQKPFCMMATELTEGQWAAITGKPAKRPDFPKGNLSYEDSLELIERLDELAGAAVHRLPTNAEWDLAAAWADGPEDLSRYANCRNPERSDGYEGLARVASFEPNGAGLYDMVGSVWEWVSDGEGEAGPKRVRRGGSYETGPTSCNTTTRGESGPGKSAADHGLRLVRDLETASRP